MSTDAVAGDFVLGIDVGGTKIALATAPADGAWPPWLASTTIATAAANGARQAMERALVAAARLVERTAQTGGGRLRTVGVSTMGVVTPDGHAVLAPNVPGWEDLGIREMVAAALRVDDVRLDNDVKLGALAELTHGALSGVSEALYLNLGTGIAAAVVSDGRIVRGAHGAAGEIGYLLRPGAPAVTPRRLEEWVGGAALARRAAQRFGPDRSLADLFTAPRWDAAARTFVDEALHEIAYHVTNLVIALDPERVVVNGGWMRAGERVVAVLRSHLDAAGLFAQDVRPGGYPFDAPLVGAVVLASAAQTEPLVPRAATAVAVTA